MNNSIFHKLSSVLWVVIVTLIVVLAVYVSVGRMLTSLTGAYQQDILRELNARVPFTLDARSVTAEWHSFTPVIILRGLRLAIPGSPGKPLELSEGRIGLDVISTLRTMTPRLTHLQLDGLSLAGELSDRGELSIRGFGGGDTELSSWLRDFVLNVERVVLADARLDLLLPSGESRQLALDLQLSREGSRRQVEAEIRSDGGLQVSALAFGVGNPFEPELFDGELYLDIGIAELAGAADLARQAFPGLRVEGGNLGVQLWSRWRRGASAAEARLAVDSLVVAAEDGGWSIPLDRVAMEASLVERGSHWGLFVTDLEVSEGDAALRVPRLQFDMWGETLRLRAMDLSLAPLAGIIAESGVLPAAAGEVLATLQPRGTLAALQLEVADFNAPAAAWELSANFQRVAVDAWRGAPGITGASGYVELAPGGGSVIFDSRQFTLEFPTVYRQVLDYEEFYGTIDVSWSPEAVTLSSGLVRARAKEEGILPVIFGLSIPLVPSAVGLEMDLLVGLEDTPVRQRKKYIPFLLPRNLADWLDSSISDGVVERGGFLWRGSLKPGEPMLRTVQLAFNVADTALRYHPGWPAVAGVDGVVLIDDLDVSVWAQRGTLLGSEIDSLSVEVWPERNVGLRLAVDGRFGGPAADGLAVVNGSELSKVAGPAFSRWQLSGDLQTELRLAMNLSHRSVPPQVELVTRIADADLDIVPGNLPIRHISGQLNYSTAGGFSSTGLVGELWGRPLAAAVGQRPASVRQDGTAVPEAVTIGVSSAVAMDDLRHWLDLELLAFARGKAPVQAEIVVPRGEPMLVEIGSSLAGVSLDLPPPWGKSADTEQPLHLAIAPGSESLVLGLEFGRDLELLMDVTGGRMRAGSLGFAADPAALEDGLLRINGRLGRVDAAEWSRVLSEYFIRGYAGLDATGVAGPDIGELPVRDGAPPPGVSIDRLQLEQLVLGGRNFEDVELSLDYAQNHWRAAVYTDWLRGELRRGAIGEPLRLDIRHLDLTGLEALQLEDRTGGLEDPSAPLELPLVSVRIDELRQADRALGDLAFNLHAGEGVLYADNIAGTLVGLELGTDGGGGLRWHQGENPRTELQLALQFGDLGQTLSQLGYQRTLETGAGEFDLRLSWPGNPAEFSLAASEGRLGVNMGKGRFLNAPTGASGALHVVSILNLAEIVQRLSLTHMFESGIPFNEVDGELLLQSGTIEVTKMSVQGSASSFQFSGESTVDTRSLDGELIVTLPVANNLPWVAALTAGLPVAAGVFVLSKVFEKQVNRLTSAVYSTTGTWDDPDITFRQIFDTTPAGVAGEMDAADSPAIPADQPDSP